jgi:hypothetical protein
MALTHVLLRNPRLKGWEYGMLRALEAQIVKQTGAQVIEVPDYGMPKITSRVGHNMRFERGRNILPKKSLKVEADVIWYILMGPENYELDLFSEWNVKAKHRIVYIYDTLQPQFPVIQKLFSSDLFNICITSFHDALPYLHQLTGKKWHAIEQAVPASLFQLVAEDKKLIPFSSYGRRYPVFHDTLLEFCKSNHLFYDFTTHDARHPTAPEEDLYRQYAWHLSHSIFTVSWPVELTNPQRAGKLHPITCRWFEAASAGTVIIGRKPGNPLFDELLHPDIVVDLDPFEGKQHLWKTFDRIYADSSRLLETARQVQQSRAHQWTWENRVARMLDLITKN